MLHARAMNCRSPHGRLIYTRRSSPDSLRKRVPSPSCGHRKSAIADRCAVCQRYQQRGWFSRVELSSWRTTGRIHLLRYCGEVPLRQRYVSTHSRNWIHSGTLSQCSFWSSGVVWADLFAEKTSLAGVSARTENGSERLYVHEPTQNCSSLVYW